MWLETDRLILRPFEQKDLAFFISYGVEPEFYRYLPIDNQTEEDIRLFFADRMKDQEGGSTSRHNFALALKNGCQTIGTIRIGISDAENGIADIGYAMDLDYQRHGFMTEALAAVFPFIFNDLQMSALWAIIHHDNLKSSQLVERLGFVETVHAPQCLQEDCVAGFDKIYCLTSEKFQTY
jgi:RimJ/RimL family protein N-acetyltransferase